MSTKPQIELFLENESGTQQVAYPFVESDHVSLSNGMDIDTMIRQDVSMPTVAHEDLSFKAGVGDQDVSSAIVDSSVAEMTIKGKTYQNILPEPSTHVLTNNKEMFKVNEGLDPNVEIVDGVSKSAILTGQTLVNLFRIGNNRSNGGSICGYKDGMIQFVFGEDWDYSYTSGINCLGDCLPLREGKKYFYRLELSRTPAKYVTINSHNTDSHFAFKTYAQIDTINSQQTIFTGVFEADSNNRVGVKIKDVNGGETMTGTFLVVEYQDGMENWDIPYFEGMQSVKMPVLTTTGKNLFDITKHNLSKDSEGDYICTNYHGNATPVKYNLKPNTKYKVNNLEGTGHYNLSVNGVWVNTNDLGNVTFTTDNRGEYYIRVGSDTYNNRNKKFATHLQIEEGSTITPYEPHKSNILSTPEEVALRGIGDVQDTLNCLTGEVVERIGEIELVNREWIKNESFLNPVYGTTIDNLFFDKDGNSICDKLSKIPYANRREIKVGQYYTTAEYIYVGHNNMSVSEFKSYIDELSPKLQYQLKTPVVKTVDLSSSGNWEKVVLDGSQVLSQYSASSTGIIYYGLPISDIVPFLQGGKAFANTLLTPTKEVGGVKYGIAPAYSLNILCFSLDGVMNKEEARAYLSQNPITVWYQTTNHKDSTQVKQPIFFKDGHIQLSSGVDNSLIPTLDYQAKTSNSYVMDLMKTNTKYTMKAKSASGTFTIDGTSYGAGTNGTFTTPTSMTNKLLVMSNKANEEVMILEGDVTSKTIPYFKGIKSAFEGEDKIEVLSTGKNLFNIELVRGAHGYGTIGGKPELSNTYTRVTNKSGDYILVKPNTKMTFTINNNIYTAIAEIDKDGNRLGDSGWRSEGRITITTKPNTKFIGFNFRKSDNSDITVDEVYQASPSIEESPTQTFYEPYKSNSAKIPLLSPLRSLLDEVCDEIALDRENNKGKIIQRVGRVVLDGSENWSLNANGNVYVSDLTTYYKPHAGSIIPNMITNSNYPPSTYNNLYDAKVDKGISIFTNGVKIGLRDSNIESITTLKNHLQQNPVTVYYELETPVITEVDLEGFPYIYKDGHIFLNGEVTPVTEIKYSINQSHMIEASNQDIIRHQKEIDYLYKLIGKYVRVDYKNTLLSLNLELK